MPKILALSSSPRRGGNTEIILNSFCEGVKYQGGDVETIRINDITFRPCQACDRCSKNGVCVVKDDMQNIYTKIVESDGIVLAAPVFFGSIAAQAKMFIDRFQCWWHAKYRLEKPFIPEDAKKPGFFICVGALKNNEYCESASKIVKVFFHNINHQYAGDICLRGYDEKGSIRENSDALKEAFQEGVKIIK